MSEDDVAAARDRTLEALLVAIELIEWERYVKYDEVAETIGGWPRYETSGRPNNQAMHRANDIREMAGLPLVDYAKDYPGCGYNSPPPKAAT